MDSTVWRASLFIDHHKMKTVGIVMLQLLAVYSVHSAYIPVPDRVPGINTRFLRPGGNDCTFCYNGGILVNDACLCPANYGPPCCSEVDGAIDGTCDTISQTAKLY